MSTMKIGSLTLTIPSPYAQGHTCTAAEAQVLNQALHRRLRVNLAERFHQIKMEYTEADAMLDFNAYIRSFSLNGSDPVRQATKEIALDIVKQKIKAEGKRLGDYSKAELSRQAELLLRKPGAHRIYELAKHQVRWIEGMANDELTNKEW